MVFSEHDRPAADNASHAARFAHREAALLEASQCRARCFSFALVMLPGACHIFDVRQTLSGQAHVKLPIVNADEELGSDRSRVASSDLAG